MLRPDVDALASRTSFFAHRVTPGRPDRDGARRRLAVLLLERQLVRLGRTGVVVERRLAPSLLRLQRQGLYRLLGYVRLGDYLTERLGMSLRRCQAILRLERALGGLPGLRRSLEAGEVSLSKLEAVAGVATAATEGEWLERARRLPIAALRAAVREAAAATEEADVGVQEAGGLTPEACVGKREGGVGTLEADVPAHVGAALAAEPSATSTVDGAGDKDPSVVSGKGPGVVLEEDEPGRMVWFAAPAGVVAIWHWTLDLVRRVAGQQEPAWRCAEYLAAEFLSGVPERPDDPENAGAGAGSGEVTPDGSLAGPVVSPPEAPVASPQMGDSTERWKRPRAGAHVPGTGMAAWTEATAAVREALASLGRGADPESILEEEDAAAEAWEVDARLRRRVRLRQSLAWRQGRLLGVVAGRRLYRDLGYATLDDWVTDRLAMSARRARYLVSLDRRLRHLPLLEDAYRRGLVTWCQARLLIRVVRSGTEGRWVRYARQVTVRRLEEAVVAYEVAAAHGGAPLPPREPSPGRVGEAPVATAGLHTSAPGGSDGGIEPPPHTSAPPSDPAAVNETTPAGRHTFRRISFWAPLDVADLWDSALRACRAAAGRPLEDWECFLVFVRTLRDTWENTGDPHWKRRYRIFERDGWRCRVPGCTSRRGLNEHHVVFRSQQGGDDDANLVTLCHGHHQQGVHAGRVRCFGRAPDALWWDLGTRPGREPLARYFGERVVTGRPHVRLAAPAEAAGDVVRASERHRALTGSSADEVGFCKPSAPRGGPVAGVAPRARAL